MKLRLMLKGPARLIGADAERTIETGSLVVGRSPDADWTIPDPDRLISKQHFRIDRTERGFTVTDMSTNGLLLNNIPVEQGFAGILRDGDLLTLGEAIIGVEVRDTVDKPVEPVAQPTDIADGASIPFPEGPFGLDAGTEAAPHPVAEAQQPSPPSAIAPAMQDWWNPSSARIKPNVPLDHDGAFLAVTAPFASDEAGVVSTGSGDTDSFSKAAEGVDAGILVRAIEKAILILPDRERQAFQDRLREILREETSR